ncbi:bacillithiol biosynthesis deacetylase BshB1 [Flavobacteriaceae bacterium]|jgi:N-acetylglucosamine malate deacetylase 1|nr:bacillithiol biosynthesis deacetylase BshB1 [Flavobacteriaceae bacterium]MDC1493067.1 bacillithiol biosynthesis deacetylase BshB1 [Flavobacteriaceae bacterium]
MKLDILAIGAHPDDVELGCSGTLAKEINQGKSVGILDLTRGELGTRGNAEIRDKESASAAKILNVKLRENLSFADSFFSNDKDHQLEIVKIIRKYRPEVVFCNAIDDRHIDHPKASKLVSAACFLSGLAKIQTKLDESTIFQEEWRPKFIYHYIQWKNLNPDICVDISNFMSVKMRAVMAYESQFYKQGETMKNTPISTQNFIDSVKYRAKDLGRLCGVEYAEGFNVERCPLVNSIFDLK